MKVRYMGRHMKATDSRIGREVLRGEVYEVSDEIGEKLIASGDYKRVSEPTVEKPTLASEPKIKVEEVEKDNG